MAKFSMTKQKFINQWLRHFAQGINKDQYEKYVKDQYVWHVFSWELIKPNGLLIGDAARQAFNEAVKTECIFCGSNKDLSDYKGKSVCATCRRNLAE